MPEEEHRRSYVIVAHRLPVDRVDDGDGPPVWRRSPGGVAAVLRGLSADQGHAWIGWTGQPGAPPPPFEHEGILLHPVGLAAGEVERHYEGFCNSAIWPLFHDRVEQPEFRRRWWQDYLRVNQRFADAAARVAARGASVWVHDFQLMLVPAMLREQRPDVRIGFFLHVPFPPVELFNQIPRRAEVLKGLLGADLVGFQRPLAAHNFLQLTRHVLGLRPLRDGVEHPEGRMVTCGAFPISIDVTATERRANHPDVLARAADIRAELGHPRLLFVGIDRLDYTKGIANRLIAYGELLAEKALIPGEAVLVQQASPTRERAARYRELRQRIEGLAGHLNGAYGRMGSPAVYCSHQPYSVDEAAALYRAADVMLVTPLRDGMNLIAKEYVASRTDERGVLVISEFAGAAAELRQAVFCNPHDVDGLKEAIMRAATMDPADAAVRMRTMRAHLRSHDAAAWMTSLQEALVAAGQRT